MGSLKRFDVCKYGCNIYIETGTGSGSCLDKAVNSKCFDKCYSVDIDAKMVNRARQRFPSSQIEIGTSVEILEKWLSSGDIKQEDNVLFFLDAHFPDADFNGGKFDVSVLNAVPLQEELELIKKYRSSSNNYIICDDARIYRIDQYQNGNVEWLQVPGGMLFIYNMFSKDQVSINLLDEGYILIDDRGNNEY